MPSKISDILMGYKKALDGTKNRFEEEYSNRVKVGAKFYDDFFNDLVKSYDIFEDSAQRRLFKTKIDRFFGGDEVNFVAIDGTLYKEQMGYYVVFFGASYGVRGKLKFIGDPPRISYESWSIDQDTSMVAYVPVPFAELGDLTEKEEKQFIVSDDDKIDLSGIHRLIMLLAEVYLAYDLVKTSSLRPKLVLWDQSITGVLMHTDIKPEKINLIGHPYLGRKIRKQDVIIAYSHPFNSDLEVPSNKLVEIYNWVLRKLEENNGTVPISELTQESEFYEEEILNKIKNYLLKSDDDNSPIAYLENGEIKLSTEYKDSWKYIVHFFEHLCERLFKDKDQDALIYEKELDGKQHYRWMSPDDLRFLISIGLRSLIELCWRHQVLFVGIVKDSSARYLTKNYLGVLRHIGKYDFKDVALPWTDRMYLESLPLCDENLNAPWTTIEFDSLFATLRLGINENREKEILGVQGFITTPERVVLKSLVQFYLNRNKRTPLAGHVIFLDRLAVPKFDKNHFGDLIIPNKRMGNIEPFYFDINDENFMQDITIYLINTLTRNLFPEVVGYPDPLHKADRGAKTLLDKVVPMIKTSGTNLKINPLFSTLRQLRDGW